MRSRNTSACLPPLRAGNNGAAIDSPSPLELHAGKVGGEARLHGCRGRVTPILDFSGPVRQIFSGPARPWPPFSTTIRCCFRDSGISTPNLSGFYRPLLLHRPAGYNANTL